jgi:hypothetical protein
MEWVGGRQGRLPAPRPAASELGTVAVTNRSPAKGVHIP